MNVLVSSNVQRVFFGGISGRIEGILQNDNLAGSNRIAIFFHSDPKFGGSFKDEVIQTVCAAFIKNNFTTLCVNARGVGRSEGVFEPGIEELSDAAFALDWLEDNNVTAKSIWVIGFSFSSWVTMQLAMRRPEIDRFVLLSPMVDRFDSAFCSSYAPVKGLIVQGTLDSVTKQEEVMKFFSPLIKNELATVEYTLLKDGDHFFRGKQKDIFNVIDRYLQDYKDTT